MIRPNKQLLSLVLIMRGESLSVSWLYVNEFVLVKLICYYPLHKVCFQFHKGCVV